MAMAWQPAVSHSAYRDAILHRYVLWSLSRQNFAMANLINIAEPAWKPLECNQEEDCERLLKGMPRVAKVEYQYSKKYNFFPKSKH